MSVIKNLWTVEETQSRINTAISGISGSGAIYQHFIDKSSIATITDVVNQIL